VNGDNSGLAFARQKFSTHQIVLNFIRPFAFICPVAARRERLCIERRDSIGRVLRLLAMRGGVVNGLVWVWFGRRMKGRAGEVTVDQRTG